MEAEICNTCQKTYGQCMRAHERGEYPPDCYSDKKLDESSIPYGYFRDLKRKAKERKQNDD